MAVSINMKELLEAGVHFGHQTRRWNPKMKPYIFGSRNGIHIIDLQKTVKLFGAAYNFIVRTVADGYSVLFVGTKKQAHESIVEEAERCGMFYVVNRWLGGTLTNLSTIRKSVARLKDLDAVKRDGTISRYTKKEALGASSYDVATGAPKVQARTLPNLHCILEVFTGHLEEEVPTAPAGNALPRWTKVAIDGLHPLQTFPATFV